MRGALEKVEGVVSAEVDCASGRAVCQVEAGTEPSALVAAVELAGYTTSVLGAEESDAGQ